MLQKHWWLVIQPLYCYLFSPCLHMTNSGGQKLIHPALYFHMYVQVSAKLLAAKHSQTLYSISFAYYTLEP